MTTGEQFVDYSGFTYNRARDLQRQCHLARRADADLEGREDHRHECRSPTCRPSTRTTRPLQGILGFAQLADDVRAMANFIPDNTFLPGFYMDVPGVDTTDAQMKAIHDPAVDLGTLPANVFQTDPFQVTASLLNPWGGDQIDDPQMRLTIDAPSALAEGDVTVTSTERSHGVRCGIRRWRQPRVVGTLGDPTDDATPWLTRGDIVSTPLDRHRRRRGAPPVTTRSPLRWMASLSPPWPSSSPRRRSCRARGRARDRARAPRGR